MKYLYIFLLLLVSYSSFAQNYPAFKFTTIKPQWDYFAIDTNFVKYKLNYQKTKYSSFFFSEFIKDNASLYLLGLTTAIYNSSIENGYLLHKINYRTGELEWIKHNNTFNKNYSLNKYGQSVSFGNSFINDQEELVILSRLSKDTLSQNGLSRLFFNTNYGQAILNPGTGEQIAFSMGSYKDLVIRDCLHCNHKLLVKNMNDYLQLSYRPEINQGETVEYFDFYKVGPDMNLDTTNIQTLEYRTGIKSSIPIVDLPDYFFNQLNKDTFLILNYVIYPQDLAYSPEKATLRWIDISNKNDIKEVHYLDIKPYYILPDSNFIKEQPKVYTLDNNILVAQRIFADTINIAKGNYWVLWLDAKGNTRAALPHAAV